MKALTYHILQAVFAHRPLRSILCWRGPRRGREVAITFDDGPNEHTTPQVLEILKEHGIRCTFFVLGREADKHPDVLGEIVAAGHEIGVHGYDHTGDDMLDQVVRCESVLQSLAVPTKLFRPPLGRRGLGALPGIRRRGYTTVLWSFDMFDSMRHEGKHAAPVDCGHVRAGEIILMHDDNPVCLSELRHLLDALRTHALNPVTVSQLMS